MRLDAAVTGGPAQRRAARTAQRRGGSGQCAQHRGAHQPETVGAGEARQRRVPARAQFDPQLGQRELDEARRARRLRRRRLLQRPLRVRRPLADARGLDDVYEGALEVDDERQHARANQGVQRLLVRRHRRRRRQRERRRRRRRVRRRRGQRRRRARGRERRRGRRYGSGEGGRLGRRVRRRSRRACVRRHQRGRGRTRDGACTHSAHA